MLSKSNFHTLVICFSYSLKKSICDEKMVNLLLLAEYLFYGQRKLSSNKISHTSTRILHTKYFLQIMYLFLFVVMLSPLDFSTLYIA